MSTINADEILVKTKKISTKIYKLIEPTLTESEEFRKLILNNIL